MQLQGKGQAIAEIVAAKAKGKGKLAIEDAPAVEKTVKTFKRLRKCKSELVEPSGETPEELQKLQKKKALDLSADEATREKRKKASASAEEPPEEESKAAKKKKKNVEEPPDVEPESETKPKKKKTPEADMSETKPKKKKQEEGDMQEDPNKKRKEKKADKSDVGESGKKKKKTSKAEEAHGEEEPDGQNVKAHERKYIQSNSNNITFIFLLSGYCP